MIRSINTVDQFLAQDAPWKKEDIKDFEKGYAQKYHHYITIGYVTKCPDIEKPSEPGHFYLSEVPSYDYLDDSLAIPKTDSEMPTNVTKPIIQDAAFNIKNSLSSGQSVLEENKV